MTSSWIRVSDIIIRNWLLLHDNSGLKKVEAIKQGEFAKRSNELAFEKTSTDRETTLYEFEVTPYSKAAEILYWNVTTM
jgi:hypothetical protein